MIDIYIYIYIYNSENENYERKQTNVEKEKGAKGPPRALRRPRLRHGGRRAQPGGV